MPQVKLYTASQIREIDSKAIGQQFASNEYILMERAGIAVFELFKKYYYPQNKYLVIFCGQGNNGGDGFVAAVLAAQNQYRVTVVFLGDINKLTSVSRRAYDAYLGCIDNKNIKLIAVESENSDSIFANKIINTELGELKDAVCIDALLGTGLNSAPRGSYKLAIEYINKNFDNIIAVDIPSGLSADTGFAYQPSVKANYTISFIAPKQGFYTQDGPDYIGSLEFNSLGVDNSIYSLVDYNSWLLDDYFAAEIIREQLPARTKNSYKHQFGHIVAVGSDQGMPGAITMAGLAALRVGAGLVSVITHNSHATEITQYHPELMVSGVDLDSADFDNNLNKADIIILGPGLGQSDWSWNIFTRVIDYVFANHSKLKSVIIDADGLNLLARFCEDKNNLNKILSLPDKLILTPHVGEARKLLNIHKDINYDINNNRFDSINKIANLYKAVVILKGVGSLIYSYSKDEKKIAICNHGNPGMATAGMGDILSGLIAGLCGQGLDNYSSSCLAVYLHAKAGDNQAELYGERGLLATDILLEIRKILNQKNS